MEDELCYLVMEFDEKLGEPVCGLSGKVYPGCRSDCDWQYVGSFDKKDQAEAYLKWLQVETDNQNV